MIIQIQKRWNELEKKKYKIIEEEFSLSHPAAKKYIEMSEEDIKGLDYPKEYKKRKTATDDYINVIYKMLMDDIAPEQIFSYCIWKGYDGTYGALDNRIKNTLKNNFHKVLPVEWYCKLEYPKDVTVIKRNDILKYITAKNDKIKKNETIRENMVILIERYPIIKELSNIYESFYSILMGDDPNKLDEFIDKYSDSTLKSFVEGLKKDIAPVKNAISFDTSSGFVEGNNNKFKLIKRILYGRSNLVNLFRKCYIPFLMNNVDFKISDLVV